MTYQPGSIGGQLNGSSLRIPLLRVWWHSCSLHGRIYAPANPLEGSERLGCTDLESGMSEPADMLLDARLSGRGFGEELAAIMQMRAFLYYEMYSTIFVFCSVGLRFVFVLYNRFLDPQQAALNLSKGKDYLILTSPVHEEDCCTWHCSEGSRGLG